MDSIRKLLLTQAQQNAKTYGNQKLVTSFQQQGSGEQPLNAPHLSMLLSFPSTPGKFVDPRYKEIEKASGGSILSKEVVQRLFQLRVNRANEFGAHKAATLATLAPALNERKDLEQTDLREKLAQVERLIEGRLFGSKTIESAINFARAAADAAQTMGVREAEISIEDVKEAVQECVDAKQEDLERTPVGTEADRKRERVISATQKILEDSLLFLLVALDGGRTEERKQKLASARAIAAQLPAQRAYQAREFKNLVKSDIAKRDAEQDAIIQELKEREQQERIQADEARNYVLELQASRRPSVEIEEAIENARLAAVAAQQALEDLKNATKPSSPIKKKTQKRLQKRTEETATAAAAARTIAESIQAAEMERAERERQAEEESRALARRARDAKKKARDAEEEAEIAEYSDAPVDESIPARGSEEFAGYVMSLPFPKLRTLAKKLKIKSRRNDTANEIRARLLTS